MRQSVEQFANAMEKRLQENDYKGKYGWTGWKKIKLLQMLFAEVYELMWAIVKNSNIKEEACDVANFAMMIYDDRSIK